MSLETTLTLALAAVILVVGLTVRVVVMSLLRLLRFVVRGAYRKLTRPRIEDALPRPTMGDRLGLVRSRARAAYAWLVQNIGGVFIERPRRPLRQARAPSGGHPLVDQTTR